MFSKMSRPVIGFLTGYFVSGGQTGVMSSTMNPRTTNLEFNIQSSRIPKSYEVGGVGLGILTVLEKSSEVGSTKIQATRALCRRNMIESKPISVNSARTEGGLGELDTLEEHRYAACYGRSRHQRNEFDKRRTSRFRKVSAYPTSDFLSSCHMCQKNLNGKDIFMYRGEKAFCSTECRGRQIMKDESKEKCRIKVSRSAAVSKSPYSKSPIFSTGILVI